MSGDNVFVATDSVLGLGQGTTVDAFSGATPLGQVATHTGTTLQINNVVGEPLSYWDAFIGLIPGSVGETSVIAILIGAVILLATGIASWRIMVSVFAGGFLMGIVAHYFQTPLYPVSMLDAVQQLTLGGFAFGAVFMATDPVTAARTNAGKYIYGFLIGGNCHSYPHVQQRLPRGSHARYTADERIRTTYRLLRSSAQHT